MSGTDERIRRLLEPILKSLGLDLWELEFQKHGPKWLLRVYIDREIGGGVTLSDCEAVSRDLSAALDVEDFIEHAYTLEVSSPGLDRALTKPEHFIRFTGSLVKIKTFQPIENEKIFRGRLSGIVGTIVQVMIAEGAVVNIPLANIAKASLEVELSGYSCGTGKSRRRLFSFRIHVQEEGMSQELIHVIDQISKEKGISKEMVVEAVESALVSAAKKKYGTQRIAVQIDPKRGDIIMYAYKKVVPAVTNPDEEITLEDAVALYPEAQMEGEVPLQVEFQGFGRIAAQTARQVIVQKVREAERDVILKEFNDKIGQLVNGIVLRHEKGAYYVDLGKTEAVLPAREQVPRESYRRGDRIRAYVLEVRDTSKGPQVVLSRAHPEFVSRLFEMEVPEIYENIVEVKGVVREGGDRTKIAVASKDSQVDPVGACVGMKGSRVQAVVRELRGEKIDIIPWSEDPRIFIAKALSPAVVEKVGVTEEDRSALAVVADSQLSLAIGKKGQNVRLAAKLTGWKIDILSESEYDQERQKEREQEIEAAIVEETRKMAEETVAAETLEAEAAAETGEDLTVIEGVGPKTAEALKQAGYDTVEKIAAMSDEEILAVPGIGEKTAQKIIIAARAHVAK